MNKSGLTYYVLSASIAVIIIMVLLQPFGIDRIQDYKYVIILGYGLLTAIALLISESLVSYVFRIKRGNTSLKRTILVNVFVAFIMGFFISCYSSIIASGTIKYGFYNDQGELELRAYFINCLYTIIISFFLFIFFYFKERSAFLAKRLQDEIELNGKSSPRCPLLST